MAPAARVTLPNSQEAPEDGDKGHEKEKKEDASPQLCKAAKHPGRALRGGCRETALDMNPEPATFHLAGSPLTREVEMVPPTPWRAAERPGEVRAREVGAEGTLSKSLPPS